MVYGACLGADGFLHASDTEVFGGSEIASITFVNEVNGGFSEGVVGELSLVELGENEVCYLGGCEAEEFLGVGDAGEEVGIGSELEGGHEFSLS